MKSSVETAFEGREFYALAAQIIPVLLLALVIEIRLFRHRDDEPLGISIWVIGFVGSTVIGELSALLAVLENRKPSNIEVVVIIAAIIYGLMLIASLPVLPRLEAIRAALPFWSWLSNAGYIATLTIVFLAVFRIVPDRVIIIAPAVLVFLLLIIGRFTQLLAALRSRVPISYDRDDERDDNGDEKDKEDD